MSPSGSTPALLSHPWRHLLGPLQLSRQAGVPVRGQAVPCDRGMPRQGQRLTAAAPPLSQDGTTTRGHGAGTILPVSSGHLGTRPRGCQDRDCTDRSVSGPVRACFTDVRGWATAEQRQSQRLTAGEGSPAACTTIQVSECCLTQSPAAMARPLQTAGTAGVTRGRCGLLCTSVSGAAHGVGAGSSGTKGQPQGGEGPQGGEQKDQASPGREWSADRQNFYTARRPWESGSGHLPSSPRGPEWTHSTG